MKDSENNIIFFMLLPAHLLASYTPGVTVDRMPVAYVLLHLLYSNMLRFPQRLDPLLYTWYKLLRTHVPRGQYVADTNQEKA